MWQVDECSTAGVGESSGFGYQKFLFVFSVFNFSNFDFRSTLLHCSVCVMMSIADDAAHRIAFERRFAKGIFRESSQKKGASGWFD